MALWIFLLLCELLCPTALILFGRGLVTCAEERSPEASVPVRCGKLWQRIGWIMLPVSVLVQLFLLGKAEAAVGVWSGVVIGFQLLILLISVVPARRAMEACSDCG